MEGLQEVPTTYGRKVIRNEVTTGQGNTPKAQEKHIAYGRRVEKDESVIILLQRPYGTNGGHPGEKTTSYNIVASRLYSLGLVSRRLRIELQNGKPTTRPNDKGNATNELNGGRKVRNALK